MKSCRLSLLAAFLSTKGSCGSDWLCMRLDLEAMAVLGYISPHLNRGCGGI